MHIPWSSVKSIIKRWREYSSTCVNLPRAGRPYKLSDRARGRLVREATKTSLTPLKELKASATEMGETLHTTTVTHVLHQSKLCGKKVCIKSQLKFTQRHVGDSKVNCKKKVDETTEELFWPSD